MIKSLLTFLLISLSSTACLGQMPDSVKINNEWRYIYPVNTPIVFFEDYYADFGLTSREFPIWIEWKLAEDPRADLKSKKLRKAIYAERFKRKEVRDSIPFLLELGTRTIDGKRFRAKYSGKSEYLVEADYVGSDEIPPLVQNLPSGKYVQFFEPYASIGKRSQSKIITQKIAAEFELVNNTLEHKFLRFFLCGDTLTQGYFDKGFKVGEWREFHEFETGSDFSVSNYNLGIQDGPSYEYLGTELREIRNYKNGVLKGEVIELNETDSIIYDVLQRYSLDVFVDYGRLAAINDQPDLFALRKLAGKTLPEYWSLRRIQPVVAEKSFYSIFFKPLPASLNLDSMQKKFPVMDKEYYSFFQTYYKIFDRESKKLIFTCQLDTISRKFSGASWFDNGQKFDDIWTNEDHSAIERIVYDLNGKVIYNTLEKEPEEIKFIQGFRTIALFDEKKKLDSYVLAEKVLRNDTIYKMIEWDPNGKRIKARFQLKGDSLKQEIHYSNTGYYLYQYYSSRVIETCKEGNLILSIRQVASRPLDLSILVDNKVYEGPVSYCFTQKPNSKKWVLKLAGQDVYEGKKLRKQRTSSGLNGEFMFRFASELLQFQDRELPVESFQGVIRNNRLGLGLVKIQGKKNSNHELIYKYGLPNGHIALTTRVNRINQKQARKFVNAIPGYHPSNAKFKRKFIDESYDLKDGLLDGPVVSYSSNGDTLGIIPFSHGLIEGEVFQFGWRTILHANFHNDSLVGDFTRFIKPHFSISYDTAFYAKFDQSGVFLSGFEIEHHDVADEIDYLDLAGKRIRKISYERASNGYVNYQIEDTNGIVGRGVLDRFDYLSEEAYSNNLLKSSIIHVDSIKPVSSSDFLSFVYGYNLQDLDIEPPVELSNSEHYMGLRKQIKQLPDLYDHYFKKYFPNGIVAREGKFDAIEDDYRITGQRKTGLWKVNDYDGHKLYELNYFDSVIKIGEQEWDIVGEQVDFDTLGNQLSKRYVLFEDETYECSNDEYYTERQFITITSLQPNKLNGHAKNYYDNGTLMNEGQVLNGLPEGLWKFYTPDGKLHKLGSYILGKENGKWLIGDLDKKAYIGGVCIDPNDPYYDFNIHALENDKEVEVIIFKGGKVLSKTNYGKNER